jgi:hypothetical protein
LIVSPADVGVLTVRWVPRDPTTRKAVLVRPVRGRLGPPRPEDPAGAVLVRARLRLIVLAQESLVVARKARRGASLAVARADVGGARVRAVIARTDVTTIEPLCRYEQSETCTRLAARG